MTLTEEQKAAAKAKLKEDLKALKIETFDHWRMLMDMPEETRRASGYSKGPEAMIQQLLKDYRKQVDTHLKEFDRGDYD